MTAVRVPREAGEETRRRLAAADLVDESRRIVAEEGHLYVPVTDPDAVPDDLDVVAADLPPRETQTMPADLVAGDISYERLGDLAIVEFDSACDGEDASVGDRADAVADALLASDVPVRTVLNRASPVEGEQRVRDWEVLAHDPDGGRDEPGFEPSSPTETLHREYGTEFVVDVAEVYFSPRLATERHRVVEQIGADERVLDMFAGAGPFAVPAARNGADVVAVDVNPDAAAALRANARRNDVAEAVTAVEGDAREVARERADWADRIVMNLPHSADEFLDAAVTAAAGEAVVHYYDIQPEPDPFEAGEAAIREAAAPEYDVTVETRRAVRSYAPHEQNVVIDARLTRR